MNSYHSPHHWIPVAIVLAIALLTLTEVHGQRTDSTAVFQGRPAMAGAQAGTGAMAGPPQGGIGVQGQDHSQIVLRERSTGVADMPQGEPTANTDAVAENQAVRADKDVVRRDRDSGVAKDQRSIAQRAKNAVHRIVQRARHGTSDKDIQTATNR
jgi:hypothetical protein